MTTKETSTKDQKPTISYTDAMQELEIISEQIESGNVSMDVIAERLERALYLADLCKKMIYDIEADVKTMLDTAVSSNYTEGGGSLI